jgi:hypothetical protein
VTAARAPDRGRLAWARLWLSYQRYGLVLLGGALGLGALALCLPVWAAIPLGLLSLGPGGFGVVVLARWKRKVRATRLAERRIADGRFRVEQIRTMCGDPCFRVVARQVLARAGYARRERAAIVARLGAELARAQQTLLFVDHARGVVIEVADGRRTERPFHGRAAAPSLEG